MKREKNRRAALLLRPGWTVAREDPLLLTYQDTTMTPPRGRAYAGRYMGRWRATVIGLGPQRVATRDTMTAACEWAEAEVEKALREVG